MSARKADSEAGGGSTIRRWIGWFGSDSGAAGLVVLLLVLWPAMWYLVWRGAGNWRGVGEEVLSSAPYWLTVEQVAVTPTPAWIHCDVRADVFRDASLDGPLSILESDLVERLADAFSLHPWVKKVVRIRKYHPAAVTVEVVYRRPACMVLVKPNPSDPKSIGLLPVDDEGVLLPSGDFSPIEAARYPRLAGVDSVPQGPVGTRWGDARVAGAPRSPACWDPRGTNWGWTGSCLRLWPSSGMATSTRLNCTRFAAAGSSGAASFKRRHAGRGVGGRKIRPSQELRSRKRLARRARRPAANRSPPVSREWRLRGGRMIPRDEPLRSMLGNQPQRAATLPGRRWYGCRVPDRMRHRQESPVTPLAAAFAEEGGNVP